MLLRRLYFAVRRIKPALRPLELRMSTSSKSISEHRKILGLPPSATQSQIKTAYLKKVVELHPDKNQGNREAVDEFKDVQEAYMVLSDPAKNKGLTVDKKPQRSESSKDKEEEEEEEFPENPADVLKFREELIKRRANRAKAEYVEEQVRADRYEVMQRRQKQIGFIEDKITKHPLLVLGAVLACFWLFSTVRANKAEEQLLKEKERREAVRQKLSVEAAIKKNNTALEFLKNGSRT